MTNNPFVRERNELAREYQLKCDKNSRSLAGRDAFSDGFEAALKLCTEKAPEFDGWAANSSWCDSEHKDGQTLRSFGREGCSDQGIGN